MEKFSAVVLGALHDLADASTLQSGLGRVDLLYDLLENLSLCKPEALKRYLPEIHSDLERRPIAEQVVDQILSDDDSRYRTFEDIRNARPATDVAPDAAEPTAPDLHKAMGEFLAAWITWERFVREKVALQPSYPGQIIPMTKLLSALGGFSDPQLRAQFDRLHRMRNQLVHGVEVPDQNDLRDAIEQLRMLRTKLTAGDNDWPKPA